MPEIRINLNTEVDIDVHDFFETMDSYDQEEMFELILGDMTEDKAKNMLESEFPGICLSERSKFKKSKYDTIYDDILMNSLIKIFNHRAQLSL